MFKMGCSMARRILAIDGKASSSSSSASENINDAENSNPKKANRHKQPPGDSSAKPSKGKTSGEELNDFSKLEADPRVPLNVRQIFKITKSWKAIARTMSKTGTAMFLNLFEQNQDLFYLFERFQHLKGQELQESMELRDHAATVMATLDQSINSLSDYDNFVTYLHSIGKLHRKVPGFRKEHFWKIEQPFLKAVKQTLDERCNETIEEIYKIAIKLIIETISAGYGDDEPGPGKQVADNENRDNQDNSNTNEPSKPPPGSRDGGNSDSADNSRDKSTNNTSNKDNNKRGPTDEEARKTPTPITTEAPLESTEGAGLLESLKAIARELAASQSGPIRHHHHHQRQVSHGDLQEALSAVTRLLKAAITMSRPRAPEATSQLAA